MIQSLTVMKSHTITACLLMVLLIAMPVSGYALCEATLQWDANTPTPDEYAIFGRTTGQNYDFDNPWWSGDYTFTQCTIDQLDEKTEYFFIVRAYIGEEVSGDSNEVSFTYSAADTSSTVSNGTDNSSGGGSGGGCFIVTARDNP